MSDYGNTVLCMMGAIALVGLSLSCSLPFTSGDCADSLTVRASPADTTLAVGQQFTAHLSLRGCRDNKDLHDTYTWMSGDTTVVKVNPQTGVVLAVGKGHTQLVVDAAVYGQQGGSVITVQ